MPLQKYVAVREEDFNECFETYSLNYTSDGAAPVKINMHALKLNEFKQPCAKRLSKKIIYSYLVPYCLKDVKRSGSSKGEVEVWAEARDLFRMQKKTGEVGELILYFFVEALLKAPQILCKMGLKTNANDEVKGADGVHAILSEDRSLLKLFLGEAKTYQDFASALNSTFESIESLVTTKKIDHEYFLVSEHFRILDADLKDTIVTLIEKRNIEPVFACLISYDEDKYTNIDYIKDHPKFMDQIFANYVAKINAKINSDILFQRLEFNFFLLPTDSVEILRKEFLARLEGS
ncbi:DUF1837 domain-containing protein [Bdellovibrio sp. HCB209]|uniref:HamA C-terminal domain-containing protein n=1 Tax=Bdellovibrio sp. HCB209 TaxID=3394354 RepID=UPI0039B452F0